MVTIPQIEAEDVDHRLRNIAATTPASSALRDSIQTLSWGELDLQVSQFANALLAWGLKPGGRVAILAHNSVTYVKVILGTVRAGGCVVPLSPLASAEVRAGMIADSGAKLLFVSEHFATETRSFLGVTGLGDDDIIPLDETGFARFVASASSGPPALVVAPELGFNLIYSSGTTGVPKGILQNRQYRAREGAKVSTLFELGRNTRTLVSTPLYSNTTLFFLLSVLYAGGSAHLMEKFDPSQWLQIAESNRVSDAILVPVQYRRLLDRPDFDSFDLSSFKSKWSTSAPFSADLKREVLDRWPSGGLTEVYGMTEGGVSFMLKGHERPDKLDTVGTASDQVEAHILDNQGQPLPNGQVGEIVGRSPTMMVGYYNREAATQEASWYDEQGRRFQRSGDLGWLDDEGFLHLLDRKKDMIISGGFNVYAIDLENVLAKHSQVIEATVIAVPSREWGETPVAYVVLRQGADAETIRCWANERLGKGQRIAEAIAVNELPRSPIGKVLKRELLDQYTTQQNQRLIVSH